MKLASILIFSLLSLSNCDSQSLKNLTLNYNAATRGSSVTLNANSLEIIYITNNTKKEVKLPEHQWNKIKKLVSKIDLHTIQNLKAPSEGRYTDRALATSISIKIGEETYRSVDFDHGNPPIELKKLINGLFEIVRE